MISEEVREVMNIIIASVDEQFTNNEHVNKFFNTKTTFYDFISKYFNELADNERSKIKIVPPTDTENWKLELNKRTACEYCNKEVNSEDDLGLVMLSDSTELFVCSECTNKYKNNNLPAKDEY